MEPLYSLQPGALCTGTWLLAELPNLKSKQRPPYPLTSLRDTRNTFTPDKLPVQLYGSMSFSIQIREEQLLMKLLKCLCLLLAFCALPVALRAQTDTGSISGSVMDPNGAVILGAKVVATHVPTGRQYSMVTSQAGLYVFPSLPTGPYTLSATQTGFKAYLQTGIEVRVGLRETIDIRLALGTVKETVEVKATAPVLETANATRGVGLSPQLMTTLPLWNGSLELANGFVNSMPGVNVSSEVSINGSIGRASEVLIDGASLVSPESGGLAFSFPGFYGYSEMKLVTSGFTAENGRVGGGIQEFVSKSGTNALHGAVLYNWKRQIFDAVPWSTNANPAARTCNGITHTVACRPMERYNEKGGYIGGPVYIPHVYDGRNKTFFYFSYVGFWQPAAITVNSGETVPTAAMKQGDFSALLGLTNPVQIYDPATTVAGARTAFTGNIIPSTRFSTISKNILSYIPAPNAGAAGQLAGNYTYNSTNLTTDKDWSVKIDHSIHTRNRIAFFMTHRLNLGSADTYLPGPLSDGLDSKLSPWYERASDDFVITPHMLLHSIWGFSQDRQTWNNPLQNGWGSKFGFTNLDANTQQNATPIINFGDDLNSCCTSWGMNQGKVNNGGQYNWTTMVAQQLTWIHSKHEIKMGWEIRRMRTVGNDWAGTNGTYNFDRVETAATASSATTGAPFASFLLGQVDSASQTALPIFINRIRYGYHAGFIQDTWRVRSNFTLNLGFRYEVPIGWHILNGDYSTFSPDAIDPVLGNIRGAEIYMGKGPNRIGNLYPYPKDFSDVGPRIGFAWNVKPSVVVRAAWGIYYEALGNGGCGCTDGFGGGSFSQYSDGFNQAFNWDPGAYNPNKTSGNPGGVQPPMGFTPAQQLPGVDNFNGGLDYITSTFGKAPRIYDWNFTLQKEYKKWLLEAGYVGNRAFGMNSSNLINALPTTDLFLGKAGPTGDANLLQAPISDSNICLYSSAIGCTNNIPNQPFSQFSAGWGSSGTLAQALRPYPQFGDLWAENSGQGRSWYDSLQTKVEHRFGDLNFMAGYVYSKNLSVMSYRQIFDQGATQGTQDAYNVNDSKSYMHMDIPHYLNVVLSYRLPFGKGKKFMGNTKPALDKVVGGWTVASLQAYHSGTLLEVTNPSNYLGSELFDMFTKADSTGLPIRTGVKTSTLDPNNKSIRWFNSGSASPYVATPAFTLGNASIYNTAFRNPWVRSENISLSKDVKVWESVNIHYQLNVFNLFNRTDFGGINGTIGSANFGVPTGAQLGPRNITMGLRLEF